MSADAPAEQLEPIQSVSLVDYATICAAICEGDRTSTEVLAQRGLDDRTWASVSLAWMRRMAEDVQSNGEKAKLPMLYADAFGRAQASHKAVVAMSVEDWARLTVDIMSEGAPGPALLARKLSSADYLRLARHFATLLSTDSVAARQFETTFAALQPTEIEG